MTAFRIGTNKRIRFRLFFRHERSAFRTLFIHGFVPEYLIAIGIPAASVEYLALPALSHDDITSAFRTFDRTLIDAWWSETHEFPLSLFWLKGASEKREAS